MIDSDLLMDAYILTAQLNLLLYLWCHPCAQLRVLIDHFLTLLIGLKQFSRR